jgi:hypothetical protein
MKTFERVRRRTVCMDGFIGARQAEKPAPGKACTAAVGAHAAARRAEPADVGRSECVMY